MFSTRIPSSPPNRLALARAARSGPLVDLTETNPTAVGLAADGAALAAALADPGVCCYAPDPRGLLGAREALCAELGAGLTPADVFLCAASSEAYALLFKLLCDPGDEVLVPRPSYPLLEHLATLEGVRPRPYALRYEGRWRLDAAELAAALSPRTRAILVVNPNNPTSSFLCREELEALDAICQAASPPVALIADEVFADYAHPGVAPLLVAGHTEALTFVLGGLSKSAGLPQLKLSWIALHGDPALRAAAAARLELINDTYLSASTAVQLALPRLLRLGASIRARIRERVRGNLAELARAVRRHPCCDLLRAEGGWTAVIRVPALRGEEQLALELLGEDGVLVHPGYFFDFEREAFFVVSLLPPAGPFAEGVERLLRRAEVADVTPR